MRRSETAWQTTWPGAMLNVDWEEEEGNCNLRDAVESRQIIVIRNNGRGSSFSFSELPRKRHFIYAQRGSRADEYDGDGEEVV